MTTHTADDTTTPTTTADPRPFLRHMALARAWCQWNGQRGTERQVLARMRRLDAATLTRLLAARGALPEGV